jgi:hypothetical protein
MEELHDRERQYLYGFLHIDPLEASGRDGTIPAVGAFKSDSPLHVCEMIFVLNCLSSYCDLHIHEINEYALIPTIRNIMAFGCAGPFGRIFVETNTISAENVWNTFPLSYITLS